MVPKKCFVNDCGRSGGRIGYVSVLSLWLTTSVLVLFMDASVCAQTVLNNPSDKEIVYTTLGDNDGQTTSKLLVTNGKAYIKGGKVVFGTGSHRLVNEDARGQYISVVPSGLVRAAMKKVWVLGIRVDEMRFGWELDKTRKHVFLKVDELKLHDKTVAAMVSDRQQTSTAEDIVVKDGRVTLRGIPDLPFAAGRTYITGDTDSKSAAAPAAAEPGATVKPRQLTIGADGTIAKQDILVHFTSPVDAEPESALSNVTLVNEYKDNLVILEIRGVGGDRTSLVYCDKGASLTFDAMGEPVAGQGKFEVQAVRDEGQSLSGWLAERKTPHMSRSVKSVSFQFVRNAAGQTELKLLDVVEATEKPKGDSGSKPVESKPAETKPAR